jgi:hypothetical protein
MNPVDPKDVRNIGPTIGGSTSSTPTTGTAAAKAKVLDPTGKPVVNKTENQTTSSNVADKVSNVASNISETASNLVNKVSENYSAIRDKVSENYGPVADSTREYYGKVQAY